MTFTSRDNLKFSPIGIVYDSAIVCMNVHGFFH